MYSCDAVTARGAPLLEEEVASFIADFRAAVRAVSQSSARECLVVCYTREVLGQTGAGHFSPVGGFDEETDSVLILDVARFKRSSFSGAPFRVPFVPQAAGRRLSEARMHLDAAGCSWMQLPESHQFFCGCT
eukprot:Skav211083  [mRNA]  locus=scaffold117:2766:5397:+ [translate_table: standard]